MMSCIRRTSAMSLVVVILLIVSLLTIHLPTACARQVVVLNPNNNGLDNRGNENLGEALASTDDDDLAASKVLPGPGRKLGAPNKEGTKATEGATTTTTSAGSRPRTVKMRAAAKHGDAVTEMYDMLRRDYASRASRRRPINNGATPLQVNKKP
ncbi:unnamed protein product [Miscanthus lutarioriparius]|uniref:Transmembrane protein n=1 Tax=Miscanthus lutarioriparius TaxID=422564 RepID=A0A811QX18_9POAL|nr:unnamed protein product [Miscanthus lutarioriparius]